MVTELIKHSVEDSNKLYDMKMTKDHYAFFRGAITCIGELKISWMEVLNEEFQRQIKVL